MRYSCVICGGAGICEHGRMRSHCKSCSGSAICEHGRQRSSCKSCGGCAICEHGRRRIQCKRCGAAVRGASTKEAQHKPRQTRAPSRSQQLNQDDPDHKQERDISRRFHKSFPPHDTFQGTITEYDPRSDNYAIVYDDGDDEVVSYDAILSYDFI